MRILFALLLAACGASAQPCSATAPCPSGKSCVWLHRQMALACATLCQTPGDCGGGSCSQSASSCAECQDLIKTCD
jgi:hypothetical protein